MTRPAGRRTKEWTRRKRQRRAALGDLRHLRPCSRREAYAADITYGTNSEFGFDFLRDNMVLRRENKVQRPLAYAIVDEVDNILIDEARTPLIISGQAEESLDTYRTFAHLVPGLQPNADFTLDLKSRTVALTEPGIERVERTLGIANLFEGDDARLTRYLEAALRAQFIYHRDRDYVVRDGEVLIVDEFTGRLMPGRRYSEGLHQAIEAKEGVKIETRDGHTRHHHVPELLPHLPQTRRHDRHCRHRGGRTVQDLLAGRDRDPTHLPMIREDHADIIFRTEQAKYRAAAAEIERLYKEARPVLVGTVSVESSERLADMLRRRGVPHEVLNAKNHEREAQIITQAGEPGAVTIATNMAGRGTDIKLGDGVAEGGGLFVLGTERHESRRIDNQLRGRSGRQGDPGGSRFYVSFEDSIMRRFTPDWLPGMMERLGMDDDTPLESGVVGRALEQAQQKVEAYHFDIRKHLVEYDDVINRQREVIYGERDKVLAGEDIHAIATEMLEGGVRNLVGGFQTDLPGEELDEDLLWSEIQSIVPLEPESWEALKHSDGGLSDALLEEALRIYSQKEEELDAQVWEEAERSILLRTIDRLWIQHLTEMDSFRQGVGLQAYGQQDPLVTYKREAFDMFEQLTHAIRLEAARNLLHARPAPPRDAPARPGSAATTKGPGGRMQRGRTAVAARAAAGVAARSAADSVGVRQIQESSAGGTALATTTESVAKVGRNQPCPCGSGKKYKKCHGQPCDHETAPTTRNRHGAGGRRHAARRGAASGRVPAAPARRQPLGGRPLGCRRGLDLPEETVDGRHFAYLIGGEAFDWLLLAERLCEEALRAGLAPESEVEALLWEERFPQAMDEETFKQRLGPAKYRAHLNFVYGVRVEEALQLTVELQVQKERGSIALNHDPRSGSEQDPFARIYGATSITLLREFRDQAGAAQTDRVTLNEWKQFTYWLFKRRLAVQDPARVASDTRRGLLQLQRLEELKQQRLPAGGSTQAAAAVIDSVAVPVR